MNQQDIIKAVQLASDIAKPGLLPVLANIVIGNNRIIASDVDSQITIAAPFDFEPYTVPAAKFKGILATLPSDAPFKLDHKDGKLSIKSGRSKFTCQTLPVEGFPMMELGDPMGSIQIDQGSLKAMLQAAQHVIPSTNTRQMLNGACLDFSGDELNVIGCDGSRMAWSSLPLMSIKCESIIPHRAVARLIKILNDGMAYITLHEGKAVFTIGDVEFITKLCVGKYPDWRRIIPKNPYTSQVDRELMLETLSRASTVLDKVRGARITIGSTFEVACTNSGESASDDFPIKCDTSFTCGMNPDYLRDALATMSGDEVTLSLSDAKAAWMIEDSNGLKAVVMPLRN